MSTLVEVRELVKVFPLPNTSAVVHAVNHVSFSISAGETLGLVGESGSGKTTVGRCLLRLIEPTSGEVLFHGNDITGADRSELRSLRPKMQIVFQDPFDSLNPRLTVGALVEEPFRLWTSLNRTEYRDRVRELLNKVGLGGSVVNAYPHQLGAGEAQRVAIARALGSSPEFLVLDEVTSSLDPIARADVIDLLVKLQDELNLTYLFISHDLSIVRHLCSRVAIMYLGKLVEIGETSEIFREQLHPYSRALLSSVLYPDPKLERSTFALSGEIPSPIDLPDGCFLHSRCPVAMPHCQETFPQIKAFDDQHSVACYKADQDRNWASKLTMDRRLPAIQPRSGESNDETQESEQTIQEGGA